MRRKHVRNPKTKRHALGIYVTKKGAQGALPEIKRKFKAQFESFRIYQDRWKQWVVDAEVKTKKPPPRKAARPRRGKVAHNPGACNNPRHAHRNPGLAGIMDKREAAKARSFA